MTKRKRTALFIFFVFLFFLIAPSIVLYSQGYRFDAEKKYIVQTGAFYIKALPRGNEVFLNDKFEKKSSVITGSIMTENLIPKTYKVEVKKAEYYSWQKNLEIIEKQVTEAKNIILFPENPGFTTSTDKEGFKELVLKTEEIPSYATLYETAGNNTIWLEKDERLYLNDPEESIAQDIKNFKVSPDSKKVVYSNNYEIWILFLEDQNEQPSRKKGEKIFLNRFSEKIGDVFWLNNYYLIFNIGKEIKISETDNRDKVNIISLTRTEFENPDIFWDQKNKAFYILSNNLLYAFNNLLP
ncbi:MAG: hypothetical protein ABH800_02030 [Candidatus Nealsonbacteria bacterium]